MQESLNPLSDPGTGGLPALSGGEASQAAGHGLVVHTNPWPHAIWLDVVIALAVALAAPLLLKKLLETEFAVRLFRTSSSVKQPTIAPTDEEFNFDA